MSHQGPSAQLEAQPLPPLPRSLLLDRDLKDGGIEEPATGTQQLPWVHIFIIFSLGKAGNSPEKWSSGWWLSLRLSKI